MLTALRRRAALLGTAAALSLALAACGGDDTDTADTDTDATETASETDMESESEMESDMEGESEMESDMESVAESEGDSALTLQPVGDACSAVPAEGEGSSAGMANDPVATAASNNPLLSTLVDAVGAAELGDTLNSAEALTVFAPINDAFEAIPEEDLNALLEDPEALGQILQVHVVGENLTAEDLQEAGTVQSLEGTELTLDFDAGVEEGLPTVSSGATTANVICANVQTANATVHLIDTVLMPADSGSGDSGGDTGSEDGDDSDSGEGEED